MKADHLELFDGVLLECVSFKDEVERKGNLMHPKPESTEKQVSSETLPLGEVVLPSCFVCQSLRTLKMCHSAPHDINRLAVRGAEREWTSCSRADDP